MKKFLHELRNIFNASESMAVDTEMLNETTVQLRNIDLKCLHSEAISEGYPEMEALTRELLAARSLIDGVASCGSCGACSGAAQRYIKEKIEPASCCEWRMVKTLRGTALVWAWQPGCDESITITDQSVYRFIVCPYCTNPRKVVHVGTAIE